MALDRQKILSELGSVVNQLQSANCGCLESLFEKSTPNSQCLSHGHAQPACGVHHHSCNNHGANRAPCSNNYYRHGNYTNNYTPPKKYFNNDIMQPIVKEVNEELKSITPENTVANSPSALQMGLPCLAMQQNAQQGFGQNNTPKQQSLMDNSGGGHCFANIIHNIKPNISTNSAVSHNRNDGNIGFNQMNSNRAANTRHSYEQAQGLAKFKEMFPGIMSNGELGFDPMDIAIQMKALNKNNTEEFKKSVNSFEPFKGHSSQQPNTHHTNHNISPDNMYTCTNPTNPNSFQINAGQIPQNNQVPAYAQSFGQPIVQKQVTNHIPNNVQRQESINHTNMPTMLNMNPISQEWAVPQSNAQTENFNQSDQQTYDNNILGQPVEMLPATVYHIAEPNLPQTLSPQPQKSRYYNVKSNMSKTSLTGNMPFGRTVSRNHLQRMYNEYKGSQSFIPPKQTTQGLTHSEGNLNSSNHYSNVGQFLERTGGDTERNKETVQKIENVGQIGDVPATNNTNNITEKLSPETASNFRNGLQDIVYPAYPTSTAWSFHGRA